ncbi:glycosyltransferase family 4 protein [Dactylosporangium sp. NPDC051541]|uniref:glycosyltransferase family 4 protein n=1 Tax=Dactylosporangium sp. NPDC051541 TaxID=3363977 RepID=UPI00378CA32B
MHVSRPRLVYVVPHLSPSEHFAHVPALLAELGSHMDVALAVERGTPPAELPGVRTVHRVGGWGRFGRLGRLLGTALTIRRCARDGYDTYFLRYSPLFLIALILTRPLYRHRTLLWRSGLPDVRPPGTRLRLRDRAGAAVNALTVPFVQGFVTGPEAMLPLMAVRWKVPGHKMRLLYNDVDAGRFAPLSPQARAAARRRLGWAGDEFVLLFVHRLSYRKGARLLAPLYDAVTAGADSAGPTVRLAVAGDGPDRSLIEQQAAVRERMQVLGAVPNRELPAVYGAADCVVMPSYEEGFARVLLESMACAVPVVTTDAGGCADVVGPDYPHIVAVGDLPGFVAAVQTVMSTRADDRAALGARMRERAQSKFSPRHIAHMLTAIVQAERERA